MCTPDKRHWVQFGKDEGRLPSVDKITNPNNKKCVKRTGDNNPVNRSSKFEEKSGCTLQALIGVNRVFMAFV